MNKRCNINQIKIYIVLILPMALIGCVAYYPQAVDIPLIKEKGDLRIDGGFATPSFPFYVHGTVSYGLTNVMATQVYGSLDFYGRYCIQGAVGFFKKFESENIIEFYGGYRHGNTFKFDVNFNNHLAFAQFNIGKTNQGKLNMDYGLGLRSGYLRVNFEEYLFGGNNTPHSANGLVIEPSVFFRFGNEEKKIGFKINYLYTKIVEEHYRWPFSISLSTNFSISTR